MRSDERPRFPRRGGDEQRRKEGFTPHGPGVRQSRFPTTAALSNPKFPTEATTAVATRTPASTGQPTVPGPLNRRNQARDRAQTPDTQDPGATYHFHPKSNTGAGLKQGTVLVESRS